MSSILRYALVVLLTFCAAIATAASVDGVRFAASPSTVQMRIEIHSAGGTLLYDSGWKDGNLLDWPLQDGFGHPLAYGSYRLMLRSRDLAGQSVEKEATLRVDSGGVAVEGRQNETPKITLTAHDGETGQLIITSGDLSFRFGDFLNRKDIEAMRLTAQGDLDVAGLIRTGKGIVFPDGSIQSTALLPSIVRMRPSTPESDKKLTPKSEISGAGTTNQVTKWLDGSAGQVGDSAITEVGGKVGIGTINPGGQLHVYGVANNDVFAGMGPDVINGPGFNYGYAGNSFGVGAGFFNVRPAAGATGVNPSLRFMTVDTQRMIITNAGNVGIGTSAPGKALDVVGDVNASAGFDIAGNRVLSITGAANLFVGAGTTQTGNSNAFVGSGAGSSNTTGTLNTFIGTAAGYANTTGFNNVFVGTSAGQGNTTGNGNTGLGLQAGPGLVTGIRNTLVGYYTGPSFTTESNNTMLGFYADGSPGITNATAIGTQAKVTQSNSLVLGSINTVNGATADTNVGIGTTAPTSKLHVANGDAYVGGNVTLTGNLALPTTAAATVGVVTLGGTPFAHNFGTSNTFLGVNAGNFTMSGAGANTGTGYNTLLNNTTGAYNTAGGSNALSANTTGAANVANGKSALFLNTTGDLNTAIGFQALYLNNGSGNIAIGSQAGQSLTTGSNNIDIGHSGVAAEANTIRIGTGGTQTRAFIAGISGVMTGLAAVAVVIDSNGQLGTISSSRRYKFDMNAMGDATDGLMRLRPVTFRYRAHGENAPLQYGLIAEEVVEVYPEMVTRNKDGEVETVMYQFLAPMLLNEVQKQHQRIEEQRAENAVLSDQLERLTRRVEQLEAKHTAAQ